MPIDLFGQQFQTCFSVSRFRRYWTGVASDAILMLGPERYNPDERDGKVTSQTLQSCVDDSQGSVAESLSSQLPCRIVKIHNYFSTGFSLVDDYTTASDAVTSVSQMKRVWLSHTHKLASFWTKCFTVTSDLPPAWQRGIVFILHSCPSNLDDTRYRSLATSDASGIGFICPKYDNAKEME